ncbi:dihydroxyacetone kinase family protein [Homoserinimonas sp. A447]
MTYLYNNPVEFADELIEGFVAANGAWVRRVQGGVVRASRGPAGEVAVIVGGGSGHYPAFAGLVGPGFAHGAAMGNLFASPSAQQVYSVAKAAHTGGGVLFTYGNYAGDVLNFTQAQERLIAEGIDCRTVVVTDDISSAPIAETHKRRGVAGDFAVFKAAAAAAEAGHDLEAVFELATRANERTRSFGVAFGGCTLPGSAEPLFTVPAGRMALGMGIHGEPGIGEQDIPTADELAELFVSSLLNEVPAAVPSVAGSRVGLILNGLGSVKYEELFVVYRRIAQLLTEVGITVVDPEVGELVTSFQMAGASLTLFWLDDELEHTWTAPASTPAYRKGAITAQLPEAADADIESEQETAPAASADSRAAAADILATIGAIRDVIDENVAELGRLDAIAGDGDHGIGMQRGATAALAAAEHAADAGAGARTLLERAADAWADKAGGTSGALWGLGLRTIAAQLSDDEKPSGMAVAAGIAAAAVEVQRFGKAELGDKTLLDTLIPFSEALGAALADDDRFTAAWSKATAVAESAAEATAALEPRIGRARPHVERSLGTPDPGAVSMGLIIRAVDTEFTRRRFKKQGEAS